MMYEEHEKCFSPLNPQGYQNRTHTEKLLIEMADLLTVRLVNQFKMQVTQLNGHFSKVLSR